MTTTFQRLLYSVVAVCLAGLLVSCGGGNTEPVYDTLANPKGFPDPALAIIDDIESGELDQYETVSKRFEELYEGNLELLDNAEWADIITRLGGRFESRAEEFLEQGIPSYYQVGGLYTLASFARPGDQKLLDKKILFDTWRRAVDSQTVARLFLPDSTPPDMIGRIDVLKWFLLSDTVSEEFAREHLIEQMFPAESPYGLTPENLEKLPANEQAFLMHAGMASFEFDSPLAVFEKPHVDLIDFRITPRHDTNWYRIELYFIPHEALTGEFAVAFRLQTDAENAYTSTYLGELYLPYDFMPRLPTDQWPVDSVAVAAQDFFYDGQPADFLIGFFPTESRPRTFAPIVGQEEPVLTFPGTVFPTPRQAVGGQSDDS
jgi:hypothetical protein